MPDPWGTVLEQPDKVVILKHALILDTFVRKQLSTRSIMTLSLMGIHSWKSLTDISALAKLSKEDIKKAADTKNQIKNQLSPEFYNELFPSC